jgi:hypothetical protein
MEGASAERRTQHARRNNNNSMSTNNGVSIVVSRVPSKGRTVRLAVAARVPRKRAHAKDKVCFSLVHYSFLDDARRFTNLDALLTRLAPVSVIHISSTEHVSTIVSPFLLQYIASHSNQHTHLCLSNNTILLYFLSFHISLFYFAGECETEFEPEQGAITKSQGGGGHARTPGVGGGFSYGSGCH